MNPKTVPKNQKMANIPKSKYYKQYILDFFQVGSIGLTIIIAKFSIFSLSHKDGPKNWSRKGQKMAKISNSKYNHLNNTYCIFPGWTNGTIIIAKSSILSLSTKWPQRTIGSPWRTIYSLRPDIASEASPRTQTTSWRLRLITTLDPHRCGEFLDSMGFVFHSVISGLNIWVFNLNSKILELKI